MVATALKRLLVGQEVTWGTLVAPTAKLMGLTSIEHRPSSEVYQSEELGTLAPSGNTALVRTSGGVGLGMDLSYEDIMFPLAALDTAVDAGAGPYTHTYSLPLLTAGAFNPLSLILDHGDATYEWSAAGCTATGLTITGDAAGAGIWQASQDFLAKVITRTTGTSAPSDRTVELIRMADTAFYVDLEAGTMGSTAKAGILRSFTLALSNGRHLKYFAGALGPGDYGVGKWSGTLTTVVELAGDAVAWIEAGLTAKVARQIRIIATSGTKIARLDFTGYLAMAPIPLYADADGNVTVELVWQGAYNSTYGNWFASVITNSVATLP